MNTYNDNLRNSVVTSLQSQEIEQKKTYAQLNASMFTLYYAEGATITAMEKLNAAADDLNYKALVKEQAVHSSNISNNELSSASQANDYLKQTISNTAVCAANVQVAANAILKLASDVGSIYSMANAADYKHEIYQQAKEVRDLMDDTAYSAELASQLAMETSMSASGVSGATVLDRSKAANGIMNSMLKVVSTDFDNAVQATANANANRATVSAEEKVAEGTFEDISVDYAATTKAYHDTSKALNLNLEVPQDPASFTNTSFIATFDLIKTPFTKEKGKPADIVQDYYIFVVKESKKLTFTSSEAASLTWSQQQAIKIEAGDKKDGAVQKTINVYDVDQKGNALQDSDGENIELGTRYVVFVLAIYTDDYKRKLNDFDDYLSAPSASFVLTNTLAAVDASTITVKPIAADSKEDDDEAKLAKGYTYKFSFNAPDNDYAVEYRCILLPEVSGKDMLTKLSLQALDEEIRRMQQIADEYDPQITSTEAMLSQKTKQQELQMKYRDLTDQIKQYSGDKNSDDYKDLEAAQSQTAAKLSQVQQDYNNDQKNLTELIKNKKQAIKELIVKESGGVGFFFNLDIAEQISAGNFIRAEQYSNGDEQKPGKWVAYIGPDATDNFGNQLIDQTSYIPVVLSMSAAAEEGLAQFTNNISDAASAKSFLYNDINNSKK